MISPVKVFGLWANAALLLDKDKDDRTEHRLIHFCLSRFPDFQVSRTIVACNRPGRLV
jgi:hypothetical protein